MTQSLAGTKRLTAIVPTFDRPVELSVALESIARQTKCPDEIIVCDDGHRSDTETIVSKIRFASTSVIRTSTRGMGAAAARNAGARAASGNWLAFLDDDDSWLPHHLEDAMASAGTADFVCANALRKSGGLYHQGTATGYLAREYLLRSNRVITSTAIVRKEVFDKLDGFREVRWLQQGSEDYDLWLRIADASVPMLYIAEPHCRYQDSGESRLSANVLASTQSNARLSRERLKARTGDAQAWRSALHHHRVHGTTWLETYLRRV
jgi:glycosyltransferase involved in cell wall biosynthesis